MATLTEIQVKYQVQHDALGSWDDAVDKDLFKQQHDQIWIDCNVELKARKAYLKAKVSLTDEEIKELTELTELFLVPIPSEPSHSTHISILEAIDPTKARPAKVKRVWEGRDYHYDCLATQTVKDEFVAGKIKVGDYLIVHYDDIGEQVVTAKIYKSW